MIVAVHVSVYHVCI